MTDISRNELLDKIAAGWKVRRKIYQQGYTINLPIGSGGLFSFTKEEILADDWEGEPPGPVLLLNNASFNYAESRLRVGTTGKRVTHIRRSCWKDASVYIKDGRIYPEPALNGISFEALNATDWEVWGFEE